MNLLSDRQSEIIEKSIKLIAEQGIQYFTTKNLAKEMGFSEAAIYKHFAGKVEIILAILDLFEKQADEALGKIKKAEDSGFAEIFMLFKDRCEVFEKKPYYARVIFSEEIFQNDIRFKEKIISIMKKNRKMILGILKNMIEKGMIRKEYHENELSIMIMGSFRLLVTQWRIANFKFSLKEHFIKLFETIQKMILIKENGGKE